LVPFGPGPPVVLHQDILNIVYTTGYRNFKDLCGLYSALFLCRGSRTGQQNWKADIGKDQSTGLQSVVVRGSQSMIRAGAGINSFLQNGQKAVAILLSSIMDSGLKDISNRVDPG
jgi:hypothetical protein